MQSLVLGLGSAGGLVQSYQPGDWGHGVVPQCLNPKTGVAVMLGPQCCCEDRSFNDEMRGIYSPASSELPATSSWHRFGATAQGEGSHRNAVGLWFV